MSDVLNIEEFDYDFLPDHTREKRLAVAGLLASAALSSLLPLVMPEVASFVIYNILIGALTLTWIYFDGLELGDPIGPGMKLMAVLFGLLIVPVYLYRSRGAKYGSVALVRAVGLLLLMVVIAVSLEVFLALLR